MPHLLRCPLLENDCSLEDLAATNEKALHCANAWPKNMTQFTDDDMKEDSCIHKHIEFKFLKC